MFKRGGFMNSIGKISGMVALFLLAGSFAFAQEITWDDKALDDDYMSPDVCSLAPDDAAAQLKNGKFSVNSFQFEYDGKILEDGDYNYSATSNIGSPLYIILSDSFAYYYDKDIRAVLCPAEHRARIARLFLEKGADPNGGLYHQKGNSTNKFQEGTHQFFLIDTPLGYAVRTGNLQNAEMLLKAGADPNYSWEGYWERSGNRVSWNQDASHFALEQVVGRATCPVNQRVKMIHLLTRYNADPDAVTRCGMTPLALVVARTGNVFSDYGYLPFAEAKQMAKALLDAGADPQAKGTNLCRAHRGFMNVKDVMKELPAYEKDQWDDFFKANRRK